MTPIRLVGSVLGVYLLLGALGVALWLMSC